MICCSSFFMYPEGQSPGLAENLVAAQNPGPCFLKFPAIGTINPAGVARACLREYLQGSGR